MKRIILILIFLVFSFNLLGCNNGNSDIGNISNILEEDDVNMRKVNIYVGNNSLEMVLEENESAIEFYHKLQENDIVISMNDYGDFEKVGSLGFNIIQSNEYITTQPGDVILYLGNTLTIYYGNNTWNFTLLGKIKGMSRESMLSFLGGKGKVEVRFSIN